MLLLFSSRRRHTRCSCVTGVQTCALPIYVGRFKGLGEMNPNQLKETTMDPATRSMLRVTLPQEYEERHQVKDLVDRLMGKHPEHRFQFIQANAATLDEAAIDA